MKNISYEKFHKIMSTYKEVNDKLDLLRSIGVDLSDMFDSCHMLHEELLFCYFDEQEQDVIFDEYLSNKITIEMMYKEFMEN